MREDRWEVGGEGAIAYWDIWTLKMCYSWNNNELFTINSVNQLSHDTFGKDICFAEHLAWNLDKCQEWMVGGWTLLACSYDLWIKVEAKAVGFVL